jgi:hypothetical protein
MSPMAVHNWETGYSRPRPYNGAALAAVLQTPLSVLLATEIDEDPDTEVPGSGELPKAQTTYRNEKVSCVYSG